MNFSRERREIRRDVPKRDPCELIWYTPRKCKAFYAHQQFRLIETPFRLTVTPLISARVTICPSAGI